MPSPFLISFSNVLLHNRAYNQSNATIKAILQKILHKMQDAERKSQDCAAISNEIPIDTSHSHDDDTSQTRPEGGGRVRSAGNARRNWRKRERRVRRLNKPVREKEMGERASVACISSKQSLQPYANLSCTGNPRRPPRVLSLFLSLSLSRLENHTGPITRYSSLRLTHLARTW